MAPAVARILKETDILGISYFVRSHVEWYDVPRVGTRVGVGRDESEYDVWISDRSNVPRPADIERTVPTVFLLNKISANKFFMTTSVNPYRLHVGGIQRHEIRVQLL